MNFKISRYVHSNVRQPLFSIKKTLSLLIISLKTSHGLRRIYKCNYYYRNMSHNFWVLFITEWKYPTIDYKIKLGRRLKFSRPMHIIYIYSEDRKARMEKIVNKNNHGKWQTYFNFLRWHKCFRVWVNFKNTIAYLKIHN